MSSPQRAQSGSRSPSSGPPPARQQQQRQQSRGNSRARTRNRSASATPSEMSEDAGPSRGQRGQRRRGQGGGRQSSDYDNLVRGGQLAQRRRVSALAGPDNQNPPAQNPPAQQPGGGGDDEDMGDKPLKLRLDLNLDVAVELKAKVHGDLTLSLLR
ncbi:hypothetical protein VKT23_010706 [Stygiomarasmius scandens]|uniref:Uncharacterized protein n=1 Tax=Marasmiellus scandens TaxID=2682957 RepID=A0ABR1JF60_9AGAR